MPFKLTYKDLSNPDFLAGFRKLAASPSYKDMKSAYNISRAKALLEQELKTFNEMRLKIGQKLNETPESERDAVLKKEEAAFFDIEFTIERHKIKAEDLKGIPLSPDQITALAPMIEDLDKLE